MFQDWLDLYKRLPTTSGREAVACPECGSKSIDYQYVGDLVSRKGYLDMWCTACKKGVHLSRVSIPSGASVISFDNPSEEITKRIPNFDQVV